MIKNFNFKKKNDTLSLYGRLDLNIVISLWKKRQILIENTNVINVSKLNKTDSIGLAFIIYIFCKKNKKDNPVKLIGVNNQLRTLINLYNLQDILFPSIK